MISIKKRPQTYGNGIDFDIDVDSYSFQYSGGDSYWFWFLMKLTDKMTSSFSWFWFKIVQQIFGGCTIVYSNSTLYTPMLLKVVSHKNFINYTSTLNKLPLNTRLLYLVNLGPAAFLRSYTKTMPWLMWFEHCRALYFLLINSTADVCHSEMKYGILEVEITVELLSREFKKWCRKWIYEIFTNSL